VRGVGGGVDHRRGEQALHALRRLDLLGEPAAEFGVLAELGPDHLDGHRPPAGCVRQVHLAHTTRAELGGEPVSGDGGRIVSPKWLGDLGGPSRVRLLTTHH
jgi:hypothetical protein